MSEKRFEYDKCTGIKDLSIDEDDDQFLYPTQIVDLLNEQQATITKLQNKNIILRNKIEDLRGSLIIQNELLQRQMQKSDLND